MATHSSNQAKNKIFFFSRRDMKDVANNVSVEEFDYRQEAVGEEEISSDEHLSGVRSFFLPLREKSKKKQRRKHREKAFGKETYKRMEERKLVQITDQLKRVSAWPDEYDTSSGSETGQKCCMTCGTVQRPRVLHMRCKEQTMFKDCSFDDLESEKELKRAEKGSAVMPTRNNIAKKQKENHRSELKNNGRFNAVGARKGKIDDMFLCDAGSFINTKHEAEFEAKDELSNVVSLGIEKLKSEYEAEIRKMRRIAQAANEKCKTSEKEKRDVEEKLRHAQTEIQRLQRSHKENAKSSARLRQEFDKHIRECKAKQEKVMQMKDADILKAQKTNKDMSSTKYQEMLAKEVASCKMHYSNETSVFEDEASCAFHITKKDDAANNERKNIFERLEHLESVISKLGSLAKESVERELKLEEELSQAKRSFLGFASSFKNSLTHGAIRNLPTMFSGVQANDFDNSSRTTGATSNGTSMYIATLCEVGKTLCSESKHIAATITNRNELVEELRRFEDYVRETLRTQRNDMRSVRSEINERKKTLFLNNLRY